jgi:predicted transcriptional regulator
MKDIVQILLSLGFAESETKTYLSSLERGPSTAADLAGSTGLSRQTIYGAIENLMERGLMSIAEHGSRTLFRIEPPAKLLTYAKRREVEIQEQMSDLAKLIPELELQCGGEKPVVKMFEGKEGILVFLEEMKNKTDGDVFEIADLTALYSIFTPEDLRPLQDSVGKSRRAHGIYRTSSESQLRNADALLLPTEFEDFHGNVAVFGDTTVLASFEGKMHSMIIENHAIANTLRILLQLSIHSLTRDAEI